MYRLCIINSFEPISKLKENFIHQEQKRLFLSDNITGEVFMVAWRNVKTFLYYSTVLFLFFKLRLECGIFLENLWWKQFLIYLIFFLYLVQQLYSIQVFPVLWCDVLCPIFKNYKKTCFICTFFVKEKVHKISFYQTLLINSFIFIYMLSCLLWFVYLFVCIQ